MIPYATKRRESMIKSSKHCDRCGVEISFGHYPRMEQRLSGVIRFGNGEFEYMDECYDLCKKCCKAFKRFMKEEVSHESL